MKNLTLKQQLDRIEQLQLSSALGNHCYMAAYKGLVKVHLQDINSIKLTKWAIKKYRQDCSYYTVSSWSDNSKVAISRVRNWINTCDRRKASCDLAVMLCYQGVLTVDDWKRFDAEVEIAKQKRKLALQRAHSKQIKNAAQRAAEHATGKRDFAPMIYGRATRVLVRSWLGEAFEVRFYGDTKAGKNGAEMKATFFKFKELYEKDTGRNAAQCLLNYYAKPGYRSRRGWATGEKLSPFESFAIAIDNPDNMMVHLTSRRENIRAMAQAIASTNCQKAG